MEGKESPGNGEMEKESASTHSTPQEHKSFTDFAKDKLDSAGREIRRRLPIAGHIGAHLMHPRRLLLNNTPSQHTDVVVTFPKGLPDSMLLWLLHKLRDSSPRLHVCVRQHASTQCAAFYITADEDILLQTAEEIHLPKLLKPEYGGGYKEFTVRDMHYFQRRASGALLSSQERGALVRRVLEAARAAPGDEAALAPALRLRVGQPVLPACISRGVVASMFPLHDRAALDALRNKWVKKLFSPQPLDEISDYFGVKIAMYFAWLGHYTQALIVPAVVGLIFWVWLGTADEYWKDIGYVLFSIFNVLWACVYLETWKRYSNVLAYKWGTLDQRDELLVEPRPLFQGEMGVSAVTGRPEPQYPAWRRRVWRHAVSLPLIAICLALAAALTALSLRAQDWWEENLVYLSWIPRAFLAIVIAIEENVYARIAKWLNDKENYRLETKYENHLILKIVLFQFVNSFMSLFYIAFYIQDMDKLREQLAVLLITRQVISNFKESAVPYLIENLRLAKICMDVFGAVSPGKAPTSQELTELFEKRTNSSGDPPDHGFLEGGGSEKSEKREETMVAQKAIDQAELESQLFRYEGTFAEHLEMLTQLAHVVLFSAAFPPAALCALASNALEVRADAFKLCHVAQRPFGERVRSIGCWQHAMEGVVCVAVAVNCALAALGGRLARLLPAASASALAAVALEHVILVGVACLRLAIPEIPAWLATEMAKVEFQRREAEKRLRYPTASECVSEEEQRLSPAKVSDPARSPPKHKINIGKIPEIPPFRPKASSITPGSAAEPPAITGSLQLLQELSPTKPIRRKEASRSLLGVRDEPLHRSAHCIPQAPLRPLANPTLQELSGSVSAGGSEPDLNASAPSIDTSSEDDKPKDKTSRSRARAALVKRVRSVAVFSLGLRRAREAQLQASHASTPAAPPRHGGELSLIPIEQLIQVDDVKPRPT